MYSSSSSDTHFGLYFFVFLLFCAGFCWLLYYYLHNKRQIVSHWHHTFDGIKFSSQDFYKIVTENTKARQIPECSYERVGHYEKDILHGLGNNREYLRIEYNDYFFDICASPFGTGFFVSWWMFDRPGFVRQVLRLLPVVKRLVDLRTIHQRDSQAMFIDLVHMGVLEAVDKMTSENGQRQLVDPERRPIGFKA
jgi:hypothetical protein